MPISELLSSITNTDNTASRSLKRRYTATPAMSFFTSSAESFNPRPYLPHASNSVNHAKPIPPLAPAPSTSRSSSQPLSSSSTKAFDPAPNDPKVFFLHPPFVDFPNCHMYPDGLTYNVLADNPEWFLDPADFRTENDPNPDTIPYPTNLEPPRGWCPLKKNFNPKGNELDDDMPKLRCTFCRRKYAGVNAKSMWRRHVLEKHKIPMANRRDGPHEGGRCRRGANKENRHSQRIGRPYIAFKQARGSEPPSSGTDALNDERGYLSQNNGSSSSRFRSLLPAYGSSDDPTTQEEEQMDATMDDCDESYLADSDEQRQSQSPTTSPRLSSSALPSSASLEQCYPSVIQPQSPYDPSKTPAFKHTANKPRRQQPWRFPSPSHPLYSSPDELCLGVPVKGMVGEGLRSAYVPAQASPLSLGNDKRSPLTFSVAASPLNSSPLCSKIVTGKILGWKRSASDSRLRPVLPLFSESAPRRLFSYQGPLPVPVTERLEYIQGDISTDAGDEISTADSSFTSDLGDPFKDWFNISAEGEDADGSLNPATRLNFSDSPVIHASDTENVDDILNPSLRTNSWKRQQSGVGLGISIDSGKKSTADAEVDDLFFQFTRNGTAGEWSLEGFAKDLGDESEVEGELMYPPHSQCNIEDADNDIIPTDDESTSSRLGARAYCTPHPMSPPLKRRRTVM